MDWFDVTLKIVEVALPCLVIASIVASALRACF